MKSNEIPARRGRRWIAAAETRTVGTLEDGCSFDGDKGQQKWVEWWHDGAQVGMVEIFIGEN